MKIIDFKTNKTLLALKERIESIFKKTKPKTSAELNKKRTFEVRLDFCLLGKEERFYSNIEKALCQSLSDVNTMKIFFEDLLSYVFTKIERSALTPGNEIDKAQIVQALFSFKSMMNEHVNFEIVEKITNSIHVLLTRTETISLPDLRASFVINTFKI